ncbi:MAG: alpha/beta fold hydrolase [Arenicellales bacterium]
MLISPLVREGSEPPFYVVPSAGTTPLSLFKMARSLSCGRPVYSFAFAGMSDDEAPHGSVEEMASAYVGEILDMQRTGPYYLGGHCFGGTVAFEMARVLEADGHEVAVLALLETMAPEAGEAGHGEVEVGRSATAPPEDKGRANRIIDDQLHRRLERLPPGLGERFARFYDRQVQLRARYCPPPIQTGIVLLRTSTFPETLFRRWRYLTTSGFTDRILPGDMFSILSPPHVEKLGRHLDELLGPAGR